MRKKNQFETLLPDGCGQVGGRFLPHLLNLFFVMGCTFDLSQGPDNSCDEGKIIFQDRLRRFLLKFSGALCLELQIYNM